MIQLPNLIKTDIIKIRSSNLFWMHLYMPLIGIAVFLSYYSFAPWTSFSKVSAYLQVVCIVFPLLCSVITSLSADQEFSAGAFQNILTATGPKLLSVISKLILFIFLGMISLTAAVMGFYIGFGATGENIYPFTTNILIIGILTGCSIFEYIFHFFLSLRFSKQISVGTAVAESLISALFVTGMGDSIWTFVPCSFSVRFIGSLILKYDSSTEIYTDPDINRGIIVCITVTILSVIGMLVWFSKWEGKKLDE